MKRWLFWGTLGALGWWQWRRKQERMNATSIKNKVVIITGASSGIGRSAAKIFSAQGAHTVLVARRANLLAEVQEELKPFGTKTLTIAADLTQDEEMETVIRETLSRFGRIDVLVNNAGLTLGGYLEEQDSRTIQQMLQINLYSVIRMTQLVLPIMKQQNSGYIVNVSSLAGDLAYPGEAPYGATKRGINAFTDVLRRELTDTEISVSVVQPGWTTTAMIQNVDMEKLRRAGLLAPGLEMQGPDFVASNIVAAVRYKKAIIRLGGPAIEFYSFFLRAFPLLGDKVMRLIANPDDMVHAAEDLG